MRLIFTLSDKQIYHKYCVIIIIFYFQEFYNQVVDKADIIQATGDAIANLSEVQCLTPR
jgi:hypothetical protein